MKQKIIKICFIIGILLISLIGVENILVAHFYQNSLQTFKIPGIEEHFIPQGMTYHEGQDIFLISGYQSNDTSSCIYLVKEENVHHISLLNQDNTPYKGHCGGICVKDDHVWLASESELGNTVWHLSLQALLQQDTIVLEHYFISEADVSTCCVYEDFVWIGEYDDSYKYFTKEEHHIKENPSLIAAYKIDETSKNGVEEAMKYAISIRDKVQGMTTTEDIIVLSTSFGITNSHLHYYPNILKEEPTNTITLHNQNYPLYILNTSNKYESITLPPMSEGIAYKEDQLYILFESASTKYKFGKLFNQEYVYAYKKPIS